MPIPDLSALTPIQFIGGLLAIAAVDTLTAIVRSIVTGTFDPTKVAAFLSSHVLARVFPIGALAFLAAAFTGVTHDTLWATAVAGLAAYLVETAASVQASLGPPAVTTPKIPAA